MTSQPCPHCGACNGPDFPLHQHGRIYGKTMLCTGCNNVYMIYIRETREDALDRYRLPEISSKGVCHG